MRHLITPSWIRRLTLLAASALGGVFLYAGVGPGIQLVSGVVGLVHPAGVGPGIQ